MPRLSLQISNHFKDYHKPLSSPRHLFLSHLFFYIYPFIICSRHKVLFIGSSAHALIPWSSLQNNFICDQRFLYLFLLSTMIFQYFTCCLCFLYKFHITTIVLLFFVLQSSHMSFSFRQTPCIHTLHTLSYPIYVYSL